MKKYIDKKKYLQKPVNECKLNFFPQKSININMYVMEQDSIKYSRKKYKDN